MKKELKLLLGATNNEELVFANVSYNTIARSPYFAVYFDVVTPFEVTEELKEERAESLLDCYDKEGKYDLCEQWDCKPSELLEEMIYRLDIEELFDISLYPESIEINDTVVFFESGSCGQCGEYCEDVETYCYNKELVDKILEYWTEYHLKDIGAKKAEEIFAELEALAPYKDEEEWVSNWLETTVL